MMSIIWTVQTLMAWIDRDKAIFQGKAAVEFLISGVKYVETEKEAFAVLSAMLQEGLFDVTDDVAKVVQLCL